ncbi:hypothetical protein [Oscillatoria sp. FACHB-1406]|uniref:hypothetical protein n=1 Tax=Oscillatoria sp. FACHB-1406 TaxID=2692846 RepID=UPI00168634D3|nr:hypothetical protein [Oscillatoria sp. FACHB-1406]MBD2576770.1 hypothetical protein [Oscillatoria sp. FACHB-1406]
MKHIDIQTILKESLATGYLTIATENKLRSLLKHPVNATELQAFWQLQEAVRRGLVTQESKQVLCSLERN